MYTDFFGLNRRPFELSPDPSFLFSSEKSKEALASISYAIFQRKGFVVMTGEVGTGKTLMVRCLFKSWREQGIAFANIFAPNLSVIDFLNNAAADLGIEVTEATKGNLLRALYGFIAAQFQKGLTTVLVIDEAHQIPTDVLEEIRMLTNVETDRQKLVQVILVGQPELEKKLESFELRQLKQRIAIRCQLEPLREEEICLYIERRLNLAGANAHSKTIFPAETVKAICHYSRGIPRLVNSICDQSLIAAYALQVRVVPVKIVGEVASYLRLKPASNHNEVRDLSSQTANLTPDESWQSVSTLNVAASKVLHPDTFLGPLSVGSETPAATTGPSKLQTSYGRSLRDISTEEFVQNESGLVAPVVGVPAAKPGNLTFLSDVKDATPLEATPPSEETSCVSNLCDIPCALQAEHEDFTLNKPTQKTMGSDMIVESLADFALGPKSGRAQTACLQSDGAALSGSLTPVVAASVVPVAPVEPLPSGRTQASIHAAESTFLTPTALQSAAPEPTMIPIALPTDDLRIIWKRSQIQGHPRPTQAGRWLGPLLRISRVARGSIQLWAGESSVSRNGLLIGAAALVVVCLIVGGVILRRQARASTIAQQDATWSGNLPADPPVASMQTATTNSLKRLGELHVAQPVGEDSKSTSVLEPGTDGTKIVIGKLSRPVLRSPDLSTSTEPAPVIVVQTNELLLGNGLFDSSGPAPPGASSGGHLQPPKLISSSPPAYPTLARIKKVQGVVVIDALVDATGRVTDMKMISGSPDLIGAAMDALHNWKYEPARLNEEPIAMHMKVSINFNLH